jgi:hypothetical protein
MTEAITHYWQQVVAVLAFVIWAVRLEAKVYSNSTQNEGISKQLDKVESRLETKIDEIEKHRLFQRKEDLSNIQSTLAEMRADIKELLRSNAKT